MYRHVSAYTVVRAMSQVNGGWSFSATWRYLLCTDWQSFDIENSYVVAIMAYRNKRTENAK